MGTRGDAMFTEMGVSASAAMGPGVAPTEKKGIQVWVAGQRKELQLMAICAA